jgi:hypothetical protein
MPVCEAAAAWPECSTKIKAPKAANLSNDALRTSVAALINAVFRVISVCKFCLLVV